MNARVDSRSNSQAGLTLIELLVALPIAGVIMFVLFTSLFAQYTDILAGSAKALLRSEGQALLINMQDELLFTISFGETLSSDLTDAYAPTGGWSYNTTPQTLIIDEIALDSTRRDDDRHIMRKEVNDCATSGVSANPVALNNVIYFLKDIPGSKYDALVKRTITPVYDLCGIDLVTGDPCSPTTASCRNIAKETSCPVANVGTGDCSIADSVLTENVKAISIQYFAENNILTTFPSSADKIEVTLTLADTVYGKEVETEVKHAIRKIN